MFARSAFSGLADPTGSGKCSASAWGGSCRGAGAVPAQPVRKFVLAQRAICNRNHGEHFVLFRGLECIAVQEEERARRKERGALIASMNG
jgi:hypothetical protein